MGLTIIFLITLAIVLFILIVSVIATLTIYEKNTYDECIIENNNNVQLCKELMVKGS